MKPDEWVYAMLETLMPQSQRFSHQSTLLHLLRLV